jgi:hypothetical protein
MKLQNKRNLFLSASSSRLDSGIFDKAPSSSGGNEKFDFDINRTTPKYKTALKFAQIGKDDV